MDVIGTATTGEEYNDEEERSRIIRDAASIVQSKLVKALNIDFDFSDWFELLRLRRRIVACKDAFTETRFAYNMARRLSAVKSDLQIYWYSSLQTSSDTGSHVGFATELDDLKVKLNQQCRTVEFELLVICDKQIERIMMLMQDSGERFDQKQTFVTSSCFFPGEKINFTHDPEDLSLDEYSDSPIIRMLGYEDSDNDEESVQGSAASLEAHEPDDGVVSREESEDGPRSGIDAEEQDTLHESSGGAAP
ncbi:MAG: hypothetical protein Q9202_002026 [Teloschistes flavicans]